MCLAFFPVGESFPIPHVLKSVFRARARPSAFVVCVELSFKNLFFGA